MKRLAKILINIALFVFQAFRMAGLGLAAFFRFLGRIVRPFLKFFYYLFILPVYRFYLILSKRAGLSKARRQHFYSVLLANKRLVHVIIMIMTTLLVYRNLTASKNDSSAEEVVGRTMLAKLVTDEFVSSDTLVEQTRQAPVKPNYGFADERMVAKLKSAPYTLEEFPADFDSELAGGAPTGITTERSIPTRSEPIDYVVQAGDTLSTIARKFAISVGTVLWENKLAANSYIRPGDKLTILPATGVMHSVKRGESIKSIVAKYDISLDELLSVNRLASDAKVKIGQRLMIPGGEPLDNGTAVATRPRTTTPVRNTSGNYAPARTVAAQASAHPMAGTKLNWPTEGFRITQYYSWAHNGLDIANKVGTPIYAAAAGTVETAGWNNGGYGNQIVINHGGGMKTRYGHMSALSVHVGDTVTKGQYIGAMGSTGHSTGPHVHFEVMINGRRYNPLNYVAY
ncbi:MAG: peptidoglycan DD-metalloendopeptidase family protein [Candidatus Falkowbacteria bacterium]